MSRLIDLTGQKFTRWVVVRKARNRYGREATWWCVCECGKKKEVSGYNLRNSISRSCGCLAGELAYKRRYKGAESAKNSIYSAYVRSAKTRDLEFNLTKEEFFPYLGMDCFYCGSPPTNNYKHYDLSFVYNGIDRINNNLGYIKTNVIPCCGDCNYARSDSTQEEFFNQIKRIYERHFK